MPIIMMGIEDTLGNMSHFPGYKDHSLAGETKRNKQTKNAAWKFHRITSGPHRGHLTQSYQGKNAFLHNDPDRAV